MAAQHIQPAGIVSTRCEFQARAPVPEGDEYERLYQHHAGVNPTFHEYRTKTTRKIPVVVLERIN